MLKKMENEAEIFRAWLHKFVGTDKKIKAKDLAKKIGIPAPRITQYHLGRVDSGVRTFPAIPFHIRQAILEATKTPYQEMLEIGRKELDPPAQPDLVREIVKEEIAKQQPININDWHKQPLHIEVAKFHDHALALKIVVGLTELEGYDTGEVEEIYDVIMAKNKKHRNKGIKYQTRAVPGE